MMIHLDTSVLVDAFTGGRRSLGRVKGARQRQANLAIAACAIERGASLWTLNRSDFDDVPGLRLFDD